MVVAVEMRLSTKCQDVGDQQNLAFEIDAEAVQLGRWVVSYFEDQIKKGVRFLPGQVVGLGWTLLLLQQRERNLELLEPDFRSMPIAWREGLNITIRHLFMQRAICELFNCEPQYPSIRHAATTFAGFLTSSSYTMSRSEPADSDSGWRFADKDRERGDGGYFSLYEIALRRSEVVPYLALPSSSRLLVTPDFIQATANGITRSSTDCGLLKETLTDL